MLEETGVVTLVNRGFRGMAKTREHWHAPVGDRRTKDQLTNGERDHNRLQAGLRALVEQTIGQLANAWALRRWRGLLYRVRDLYVAPEAAMGGAIGLVCDGDPITIDGTSRQVTLEFPEAELAARRARYQPAPSAMAWGVFGKYAQTVRSASLGAVTTAATSPEWRRRLLRNRRCRLINDGRRSTAPYLGNLWRDATMRRWRSRRLGHAERGASATGSACLGVAVGSPGASR